MNLGGLYCDDLRLGDRFDGAPSVTLTDGLAAAHRAIVGGRLRLASDRELAVRVTGRSTELASPALVCDVAVGQSTVVTQRSIANLFYRGLRFLRFPAIGDTLKTRTEITGLRPVSAKPGRPPRGLTTMRIVTTDQNALPVLDFFRCAMLPMRESASLEQAGDVDPPSVLPGPLELAAVVDRWDLAHYRAATPGPHSDEVPTGLTYRVEGGDVVSSAPELARLTFNLAAIHVDWTASSNRERLVYGGQTIGIAAAQVTRALPALVTILAWKSCDHSGPVYEGDTLHSEIEVERCDALPVGSLVHLRSVVRATRRDGATADVLDWRLIGLLA